MNEGVYVEIFHDGHRRQLFFILIFLDRVFFGVRPWRICLVHGLGTISRFDLSGIRGCSFRKQLAVLARRAQFRAPFFELRKKKELACFLASSRSFFSLSFRLACFSSIRFCFLL